MHSAAPFGWPSPPVHHPFPPMQPLPQFPLNTLHSGSQEADAMFAHMGPMPQMHAMLPPPLPPPTSVPGILTLEEIEGGMLHMRMQPELPPPPSHEQNHLLKLLMGVQAPPPPAPDEAWEHRRAIKEKKLAKMAKFAGLMTQGDKEYIHKVQISQLVSDDPHADDFYCRMYLAIRNQTAPTMDLGRVGHHANAPAKTTRQEQGLARQVQRIVNDARKRTKQTQVSLDGALGKIAINSVRNPKQSLQFKAVDGTESPEQLHSAKFSSSSSHSATPTHHEIQNRRRVLRILELIYDKVLSLEQMVRQRPQPLGDRESYELMERWSTDYTTLASSLWEELRVNEPIGLYHPHSFIQILSYAKGKKLIPRVFRHCSPEQTLSAVTLITASLDIVDVCRIGRSTPESLEQAELFLSNIMPVIVGCVADVPFRILLGLVSLMIGRCNILWLAHSKVGLSFLTMYLSRGEILSQPGHVVEVPDERDVRQWMELHDTIFNLLRGSFAQLFSSLEYSHDVVDQDAHIWQFLAAVAVGASPEQQHQLVSEVRDQVLQNIQRSTYGNLSPDKAALRIANVNLFLHALGLDASQVTMAL